MARPSGSVDEVIYCQIASGEASLVLPCFVLITCIVSLHIVRLKAYQNIPLYPA